MRNPDIVDDVSLMREVVRDVLWNIAYQEERLAKAHAKLATTYALLQRCGLTLDEREARVYYDDHGDEDECETPQELAQWLLGSALWSIDHCEAELRANHVKLGAAKALMLRADIALDLDEIDRGVRKRLAEH